MTRRTRTSWQNDGARTEGAATALRFRLHCYHVPLERRAWRILWISEAFSQIALSILTTRRTTFLLFTWRTAQACCRVVVVAVMEVVEMVEVVVVVARV